MFQSQKNAFWEALLVTIFIFAIGIIFGVILENWRTNEVNDLFQKSEIDLFDVRLQTEIYSLKEFDCDKAIEENIKFADRIFSESKILDRYETASRLTENIRLQHKKYDILRTMLLINSIKIKEKCKPFYNEITYFYGYNDVSTETKAKQNAISKLLVDLKEKEGSKILLIPIAGDNDISVVNLLLKQYNITEEELPVILINRKIKIKELMTVEELSKYLAK